MARIVNVFMNGWCDALMSPFRALSPWVGLAVFSFVIALLSLVVFKFCSRQQALAAARSKALAHVLEIRLFQDNPASLFGALGRVFIATFAYLKEYLLPIAVMIVPVGPILIQMACWFEYRPLKPGETALVTVTMNPASETITTGPGLALDTEALRIPEEQKLVWRIRATEAGSSWIELDSVKKTVVAHGTLAKVSAARVKQGFWNEILNPAETAIPSSASVESIAITYPLRNMHWLIGCVVLSIVFGLVLMKPFRVEL